MLDFARSAHLDDAPSTKVSRFIQSQVTFLDSMGSDLSIVNAAKVSFGALSTLDEQGNLKPRDVKLLRYLARGMTTDQFEDLVAEVRYEEDTLNALENWRSTPIHKSPFNHVMLSFRVKAPIFVARQLVKHDYLVWNEISGRYVEFQPEFIAPEYFRKHADDVKQGSVGEVEDQLGAFDLYKSGCDMAYASYQGLLQAGVCREQARSVLPLSTMTEWVWTGSLWSFHKMVEARTREDAQEEASDVAFMIQAKMFDMFPEATEALATHGIS